MLGGRADSLRSLRERWTVGRRTDGARAESPWQGRGVNVIQNSKREARSQRRAGHWRGRRCVCPLGAVLRLKED